MDKLTVVNILIIVSGAGLAWHFGESLPICLAIGFVAASAANILIYACRRS